MVFVGRTDADDLDFVAHLDDAALDATGHHGAAARDREHVFHRHQERLVDVAPGSGIQVSSASTSLMIAGTPISDWSPSSALARRTHMIGVSSPGNSYLRQQLADFHLHQLQQLGVVHHVRLVQEHHDVRHAHLARQQDVLAVCGIGPSAAEHTRIAPSICAAPVIMFFT